MGVADVKRARESRMSTIADPGAGTNVTSSEEPPRSSAPTVCTACASAATPDSSASESATYTTDIHHELCSQHSGLQSLTLTAHDGAAL